jgi:23S rRNA pseudouridine1911/1915/1917 synthase
VSSRRVRLNGELCLDHARRLKQGDRVEVTSHPAPKPKEQESIVIRHLDEHVVVVEKPAGMNSVRHPAERAWSERRKALSPTLEDIVPKLIAQRERDTHKGPPPRLRVVHRLDKETSGLLVFARTVRAERELGKQFHEHTVLRRYLAVVHGHVPSQTIASRLVRDRGDARRGSTTLPGQGKDAVTHVELVERLPECSLISCRLETGRTHQIRIHLAERGHPLLGERVYNRRKDGSLIVEGDDAPRLALHAAELGFTHPITGQWMHWQMPLPPDLQSYLDRLRREGGRHDGH